METQVRYVQPDSVIRGSFLLHTIAHPFIDSALISLMDEVYLESWIQIPE